MPPLNETRNFEDGRLRLISVSWFFLFVTGNGLLSWLQYITIGRSLLIEPLFYGALAAQIVLLLSVRQTRFYPLPSHTLISVILLTVSVVFSTSLRLLHDGELGDSLQALYFVFRFGFLLVVFSLVPLTLERTGALKVFFVLVLAFGVIQIVTQNLLLPDGLLIEHGIEFQHFVNGRIRAPSFFPSAPRFAECLVFISCYLLYLFAARGKSFVLTAVIYLVVLYLLFNTYSRSGYILWVSALVAQLFLMRKGTLCGRQVRYFLLFYFLFGAGLAGLLFLLFGGASELAIFDAASLGARTSHWAVFGEDFFERGFLGLMFGTGEAARFSRFSEDYFTIDNVFFSVLQYAGLVGLVFFLFVYVSIFITGLKVARTVASTPLAFVLPFYLGLLVQGQFVDNHNTIFLTQLLILAMVNKFRVPQRLS